MSDEQPTLDATPSAVELAPTGQVGPDPDPPLADGWVIVRLVTEVGEADIRVPPANKWRSSARSALLSNGDDMNWARLTLSRKDAEAWIDLDPTRDEANAFFEELDKAMGLSNRSDRRRRLRAVS
jgi:hypothetical protein